MINNYQREGHSNKDITTAVVTAVTATAVSTATIVSTAATAIPAAAKQQ